MIRELVSPATKGAHAFRVGAAGTLGPADGLTPRDLATAYGLATTGGHGQTVGIVDAYNDPNINADLQTFDSHYGLLTCSRGDGCLRVVNQTGGATPPANDTTGWSVEETLDVETVHSVCPSCHIILVESNSEGNSDLGTAENTAVRLGANEVTNSFGEPESFSSSSYQADFNHPGVVITASAGDDGYYSFDNLDGTSEPNAPAAYNTTVSVGGTSLYLGQGGNRQSESVWNDNGPRDYYEQAFERALGAGGGGCSTLFSAQKWQTSLGVWGSTGCGKKRLVSDVSAVYALAGGAHGVAYPALTLYGHLKQAHDVTTGGNGWCDSAGAGGCPNPNSSGDGVLDCAYTASGHVAVGDRACDALAGYDGPTGVGSPNGISMFLKTGPSVSTAGPLTVTHGKGATWTAGAKDPFPGGQVVRYVWNWGDGTSTVTTSHSASHTPKSGGVTRTITLTVTDNYGMTGSTSRKVKIK